MMDVMSFLVYLRAVAPVNFVTVVIFWIVGCSDHHSSNTSIPPHSVRL